MFQLTKQQTVLTIGVILLICTALALILILSGKKESDAAIKTNGQTISQAWVDDFAKVQKITKKQASEQLIRMKFDEIWAKKNGLELKASQANIDSPFYKTLSKDLRVFIANTSAIQSAIQGDRNLLNKEKVSGKEIDEFDKTSKLAALTLVGFNSQSQAKKAKRQLDAASKNKKLIEISDIQSKYGKETTYFISQQGDTVLKNKKVPAYLKSSITSITFTDTDIKNVNFIDKKIEQKTLKLFAGKKFYILAFNMSNNTNGSNQSIINQLKLNKVIQRKNLEQQQYIKKTTCEKDYFVKMLCSK